MSDVSLNGGHVEVLYWCCQKSIGSRSHLCLFSERHIHWKFLISYQFRFNFYTRPVGLLFFFSVLCLTASVGAFSFLPIRPVYFVCRIGLARWQNYLNSVRPFKNLASFHQPYNRMQLDNIEGGDVVKIKLIYLGNICNEIPMLAKYLLYIQYTCNEIPKKSLSLSFKNDKI